MGLKPPCKDSLRNSIEGINQSKLPGKGRWHGAYTPTAPLVQREVAVKRSDAVGGIVCTYCRFVFYLK